MTSTLAEKTIEEMKKMFAARGFPEQVVTDNEPQFTSQEFARFMWKNGIKHVRRAPYHPSSNGAVERFVQTFKQAMKAGEKDGRTLEHRLSSFLLAYRSTPNATTNCAPATLFLNRSLRTRMDLVRHDKLGRVAKKQTAQKVHHDGHAKFRELFVGQNVIVKNFIDGLSWIPGVVIERTGSVFYLVIVRDHIRARSDSPFSREESFALTMESHVVENLP